MIRPWSAFDLPDWHKRSRPTDMPLNLDSIYCAARLCGPRPARGGGTEYGTVGTGFCVKVPSEAVPNLSYTYLVSTAHVVEDCGGSVDVQFANPALGDWVRLPRPAKITDWAQPLKDVDIAVALVSPATLGMSFQAIRLDQFVDRSEAPTLFPGSVIYYIGQLSVKIKTGQHTHELLERVLARAGTLAALDQRGLPLGVYEYPAHILDCRTYEGFSGSPCFVDTPFAELTQTERRLPDRPDVPLADLQHLTQLCGMLTNHLDTERDGLASRHGLVFVLRSEEIRKALMNDGLKARRAAADAEHLDSADAAIKPAGAARRPQGEFERFEDLTRKLVNVPKKEIDKQREDAS